MKKSIDGGIIKWWEDELTCDEREKMMNGTYWSEIGENTKEGIKKRHKWLLKAYNKFHKEERK